MVFQFPSVGDNGIMTARGTIFVTVAKLLQRHCLFGSAEGACGDFRESKIRR